MSVGLHARIGLYYNSTCLLKYVFVHEILGFYSDENEDCGMLCCGDM
jgi:hypothetical protein